jgi:hypothetical protein
MNDEFPQLACYEPSGVAPAGGFIAALASGVAFGAVSGPVYAFANYHSPMIYLNLFIAGGYGMLLGWFASFAVAGFHIRNVKLAGMVGFAAFLASYAAHWLFYLAIALLDWDGHSTYDVTEAARVAFELAGRPEDAWGFIKAINAQGIWSLSGSSGRELMAPKGMLLAAIWAAEAMALAYYSIAAPMSRVAKPYSERGNRWMKPVLFPEMAAFIEDENAFRLALSRGDYSALRVPPQPKEERYGVREAKYASVELFSDTSEQYISVYNVIEKSSKKKKEVSKQTVVSLLKITPRAASELFAAAGSE